MSKLINAAAALRQAQNQKTMLHNRRAEIERLIRHESVRANSAADWLLARTVENLLKSNLDIDANTIIGRARLLATSDQTQALLLLAERIDAEARLPQVNCDEQH